MAPHIVVVNHADKVEPTIEEQGTAYINLVGTPKSAEQPMMAGIWKVYDLDEPTPVFESDVTEVKYVLEGSIEVKDEVSGNVHKLGPGSLLWIPKGSKLSMVSSKNARFFYAEQRDGEPTFGTGV